MTAKEALKQLSDLHTYCFSTQSTFKRMGFEFTERFFIKVKNALDKQMPKKPVIEFSKKPITHNYGRLMQFFCPECKKFILAMYETDVLRGGGISNDLKGCPRCLQRIDFSGYYHKGGEP